MHAKPAGGALSIARSTMKETLRDRVTTIAGSLAFHWFLALFPAAVAFIGFAALVGLSTKDIQSILHGASQIMPPQTAQILSEALKNPPAAKTGQIEFIIGLVVALWSATEAMAALQIGLDVAYEVPKDRSFFARRLWAVPLLLATVAFGGSASALLVLGDPIRSFLPSQLGGAAGVVWDVVRWAGAVALGVLMISIYYALGPKRERLRWRWITPGSVVATLIWLAVSELFSLYLDHFGQDTKSYGAFADVAVLLLWLYISGLSVLVGAELNCELERAPTGASVQASASTEASIDASAGAPGAVGPAGEATNAAGVCPPVQRAGVASAR